jgi:hypothetical protein
VKQARKPLAGEDIICARVLLFTDVGERKFTCVVNMAKDAGISRSSAETDALYSILPLGNE